jgi:hypothetical protein
MLEVFGSRDYSCSPNVAHALATATLDWGVTRIVLESAEGLSGPVDKES